MGALLQDGLEVCAITMKITFYRNNKLVVEFKTRTPGDTIYVIYSQPVMAQNMITAIADIDYDTLYCCFAHPSHDVLKHT